MKLPKPAHGLQFRAAPTVGQALPLGNGLLAARVWGDGHPLRIALGYDVHDVAGTVAADSGFAPPAAGWLELTLERAAFRSASLPLDSAIAAMNFSNGIAARVMIHALEPVGVVLIRSDYGLVPRLSSAEEPSKGFSGGTDAAFVQEGSGLAVSLTWRKTPRGWFLCWSAASRRETADALSLARQRAQTGLATGFQRLSASHRDWWHAFWWRITPAPGELLDRQWHLAQYGRGASRREREL